MTRTKTKPKLPTAPDARRMVGARRVQAARDHIQRSIVEIGYARADLSAVIGFDGVALVKVEQALKDEWYKLAAKLERPPRHPSDGLLDRTPTDDDIKTPHAGCGQRSWKPSY